ncbi:DUF4239 domain-containing protein, partial [Mesorhizobium sp. M2A.F.Ca.ET.037.01.1.1]
GCVTYPRLWRLRAPAWQARFGFRAPRNTIVIGRFVMSAALVATAIYLIMEMDQPFSGPIQISPAPSQKALAELKQ